MPDPKPHHESHPRTRTPEPGRREVLASAASLALLPLAASLPERTTGSMPTDDDEPNAWPEADADAEITTAAIAAAERLAGISFTETERETIAATIGEQLAMLAARLAAGELPNDLAPALVFSALPAGTAPSKVTPDGDPASLVERDAPPPTDDEDIAFAPISRLATWLRRGDLTSERLTRIHLDRITRFDPVLRCMITTTGDRAIAQAKAADAALRAGRDLGPLHGITWGAKDIIDVAELPATWGATPFKDRIAPTTATVVERLDDAGAVMLGKTSVGALAYGDIWFDGRCNNPWNPKQGSSGSSAGSASGVAAGLMSFALGTETYGSIVSPCHRCGATGLRPTFGRVPRTGAMSLCWSLDKIGPITRSVADTALVLDAIDGFDAGDPSSVSVPFTAGSDESVDGLRIGWNPTWFQGANDADRAALEHLRAAGCRLVEVELPPLPYEALLVTLYAEAAAAFETLTRSNTDDDMVWQSPQAWPNTFRRSWFIPAIEAVQADRVRRRAMQAMATIMSGVDAIATPAFGGNLLLVTNATGHPTLVQPTSFEGGRPHGFTLIGRLFDEGTLIRLGRVLESAFAVSGRRPPLA